MLRSENEQNEANESSKLNQNPSKAKATGKEEKAAASMIDRLDGDWKCGAVSEGCGFHCVVQCAELCKAGCLLEVPA